jgi:hypothetical protein
MPRIIFLFSPVFFGGLCLLLGEAIHRLKRRFRKEPPQEGFTATRVIHHAGRK